MAKSPIETLESAVAALLGWFQAERLKGIIIGGVAASLLGRPRATRDVDALVWMEDLNDWARLVASSRPHGIEPRIDDPVGFAERARVLLLRHAPSGVDIDVALGALPFEEEAVARAIHEKLGAHRIPVPHPDDLVIMKAIAHRPRDVADIEAVLEAHPEIDRARVRAYVEEFAKLLDTPELLIDLDAVMKRVPGPRLGTSGQKAREAPAAQSLESPADESPEPARCLRRILEALAPARSFRYSSPHL